MNLDRVATPYADGTPHAVRMTDPQAVQYAGSPIVFSPSRSLDERALPSGGAGMSGTAGDDLTFLEAIFFVDPAQKPTVVVLTNTALAGKAGAFPDALQEAVYGPRTP